MPSFGPPILAGLLLLATLLAALGSSAEPGPLPENIQNQLDSAFRAAEDAALKGPTNIRVAGQAVLQLPTGYRYIPAEAARNLLHAMGNGGADKVEGMIVPSADNGIPWFVVVSYNPAGYIEDDDAKDWKADEMLADIRNGTEESNGERRRRGLPELEVVGWAEPPAYDAETHRLVWSLSSRIKGEPGAGGSGVNYNTLVLGREGYVSMNLVTDLAAVDKLKSVARNLLASMEYDTGKRYADFQAGTDRVAGFGLAALVAGVAAKKLGLLAMAGVLLAKFGKLIVAAGVVGLGIAGKIFGRRKGRGEG